MDSPHDFLNAVSASLQAYLSLFPEEIGDLLPLTKQAAGKEDLCTRKNLTGHVTASAIVLMGDTGRTVIVANRSLGIWVFPGGHCEPGETPHQSAQRELAEEAGITEVTLHPWHLKTGSPIEINSHPIPKNDRKGEPAHVHHDFRYVFLAPADVQVTMQVSEIEGIEVLDINEAFQVRGMEKAAARLSLLAH
jgi:8-oxo-dGTP pyrophosphatase MutT (NUDIX family)